MECKTGLFSSFNLASPSTRIVRSGLFCILFLCICLYPLFPAIILETASTNVVIEVQSLDDEETANRTRIPICDLTLHAKHRGAGRLILDHTALSQGAQVISYQLEDEQGRRFAADLPLEYRVGGIVHEQVKVGRLYARFARPLSQMQGMQSSLTIHLVLEE
ncbi:hypothetical protein SDC9_113553 [bioreactor metagenome]|jgi:hypothetical protein|uniref:Spore coat protein U domain-containing protein n=1 Tax=bioreactor metagenome TaxID=1076179 RepID=A0A645BTS5_9ZZZZ